MSAYDYLSLILIFSIVVNVSYIGVLLYDRAADRATRRAYDKARHPSSRYQTPVYLEDWRRGRESM